MTRVFVSVLRHQILPPSFAFHLSLHWSCIWVLSIHSNMAFQNLGVLAGVLPSSSIACITWSKWMTSSAVHGPAWLSAIYESCLVVGGKPERCLSQGTRCLWNQLWHAETEHSRASLIFTQVNCWLMSLDDRQLVQRCICSIATDNFNLESSCMVQGPLSQKGLYKSWARSLTNWMRCPGTPHAMMKLGFRQSELDIINVTHQCFPRTPPDDPRLEQDLPDLPHWYQLPIRCCKEYLWWLRTHLPFDICWVCHAHVPFPQEYNHFLDTVFLLCDSVTRCTCRCFMHHIIWSPLQTTTLSWASLHARSSHHSCFWWCSCSDTSVFWYQCDLVTIIT